MKYAVIALMGLLCSCANNTTVACPAVHEWSSSEQLEILAEERTLAANSILIPVLMDYARLRAEVRACR